ncbi:MAG: N-acyl-D-amino-acid deacylase family protein, partial [Candidatus Aminicenantia bacterium]
YDIVIKNGRIVDGTGNPWFMGDIGIKGKFIKKIGFIEERLGRRVIDAGNLVISPGFIDVHTHAEGIEKNPRIENYSFQGVTTVIAGNCGSHRYPLKDHFKRLKSKKISINYGSLAGHNTIRELVMGKKKALPTAEEMNKMKRILENELKAGALGLSSGLAYMPGVYSNTEELVELGKIVAKYKGIYTSHIRNQGKAIKEAIEEAIQVGEKNGIPVLISHIKLADESVWNEIWRITSPIGEARSRGVEVFLDQYPYTATSSGFESSLPAWSREGGIEKFRERLLDKEQYEKIKSHVIQVRLTSLKGINKLQSIFIASCSWRREYEGKNLEEILEMEGKEATIENGADLIIEIVKNGDAQGIFFQMDEADVKELMKLSYLMIGSDGAMQILNRGYPHPRSYGTYPRILGRYVRDEKVLTLEDAIRKMTSLPANTFRIKKRGLLKDGFFADVVIFSPEKIIDRATFANPHQFPEGIKYVIVNGEIVVENNKHTGKLPGMLIKRE